MSPRAAAPARDTTAELAFLTRALKAPTLRETAPRLADRARAESWTHEEYLLACLQREVAARESHGGEGRIRAARLPARKSLEDFDYDHARGLKRDTITHLGNTSAPSTSSPRKTTWCSSAHPLSTVLDAPSSTSSTVTLLTSCHRRFLAICGSSSTRWNGSDGAEFGDPAARRASNLDGDRRPSPDGGAG